MQIVQRSENSLIVLFEQAIDPGIARQVAALVAAIEQQLSDVVVDVVPSYASIHLLFDLRRVSSKQLIQQLQCLVESVAQVNQGVGDTELQGSQRVIEIPVYYGVDVGFDLPAIAVSANLSEDEVVARHSAQTYTVYAMGFAPGFAYLGSVDPQIAMPRKSTPRAQVPAGSLGIADRQTGIYSTDSPGGWQIIGRTPIDLVNFDHKPPSLMMVGDLVRFVPIDQAQYLVMGGELT